MRLRTEKMKENPEKEIDNMIKKWCELNKITTESPKEPPLLKLLLTYIVWVALVTFQVALWVWVAKYVWLNW